MEGGDRNKNPTTKFAKIRDARFKNDFEHPLVNANYKIIRNFICND